MRAHNPTESPINNKRTRIHNPKSFTPEDRSGFAPNGGDDNTMTPAVSDPDRMGGIGSFESKIVGVSICRNGQDFGKVEDNGGN